MNILVIVGFTIIAMVLVVAIKKYSPDIAIVISICAGVLIMFSIISNIQPAIGEITNLLGKVGLSSEYGKILFKALGICFLVQFISDACKDAGESSLASRVEFCGKIALLLISLPLFENVITIAERLIG